MLTVTIADLMERSGVAFGTSGARGLVSAMTDQVCFAYSCGFLKHLTQIGQFTPGTHVAIAGDLRPSTPHIMAACGAAIRSMGGVVDNCGFIPSPAVAAYGFARGIPSVMVTGSHIPDDRNGIKFNRIDGEILKPDEQAMRAQTVEIPDLFDQQGMFRHQPDIGDVVDATTEYSSRYVNFFGAQALKGMTIGVYEHSAVGRDIISALVEKLGATVVHLGRSDIFIPVDTEAVRDEDKTLARQWAGTYRLDAILSTDGDSDRPLIADEAGEWMRGDVLGILCAQALNIEAVAAPVSCNSALEQCGSFAKVVRTRIGSPYVIEAMNALREEATSVCGYEANGGFLLGTRVEQNGQFLAALMTRDAVLPMLAVLVEARRRGLPLSALQTTLPARFTYSERLQNYATEKSKELLVNLQAGNDSTILDRLTVMFQNLAGKAVSFDTTDGLRIGFADGDIIHLRPSGNAPELRCYTESATAERAATLNAQVLSKIKAL